jgi:hypothetical protein
MALVEVNASRFKVPYSWVNGKTYTNVSSLDIFRGAMSVGASDNLDLLAYGWRYLGAQFFQSLVTGLLVTSINGELITSSAFENKIQTEKATATYWLSMALTKLTAERRLRVPWLCHVDRLIKKGVLIQTPGTNERGDLAGRDSQYLWHIIEVKGRSLNISQDTIEQAKRQASKLTDVSGKLPATASASVVKLFRKPITIDLIDPEPTPEMKISWDINDSRFFPAYYEPFVRRVNISSVKSTRIRGLQYSLAAIKELDQNLWVGLPKIIIDNPQTAIDVASTLYENEQNQEINISPDYGQRLSIGYDGILLSDGFPEVVN